MTAQRLETNIWPALGPLVEGHFTQAKIFGRFWLGVPAIAGFWFIASKWMGWQGLEGNIIGFIGIPIVLASCVLFLIAHWRTEDFAPVLAVAGRLGPAHLADGHGLWLKLPFFILLNPLFLFWLCMWPKDLPKTDAWGQIGTSVFTAVLFYAIWTVIVWGVLKFSGATGGWSRLIGAYLEQSTSLRGFVQIFCLILLAACVPAVLITPKNEQTGTLLTGQASFIIFALIIFQAGVSLRALSKTCMALTSRETAAESGHGPG